MGEPEGRQEPEGPVAVPFVDGGGRETVPSLAPRADFRGGDCHASSLRGSEALPLHEVRPRLGRKAPLQQQGAAAQARSPQAKGVIAYQWPDLVGALVIAFVAIVVYVVLFQH